MSFLPLSFFSRLFFHSVSTFLLVTSIISPQNIKQLWLISDRDEAMYKFKITNSLYLPSSCETEEFGKIWDLASLMGFLHLMIVQMFYVWWITSSTLFPTCFFLVLTVYIHTWTVTWMWLRNLCLWVSSLLISMFGQISMVTDLP